MRIPWGRQILFRSVLLCSRCQFIPRANCQIGSQRTPSHDKHTERSPIATFISVYQEPPNTAMVFRHIKYKTDSTPASVVYKSSEKRQHTNGTNPLVQCSGGRKRQWLKSGDAPQTRTTAKCHGNGRGVFEK
uniref:Putative secreted protein n=1 Tax=Ixodes ricinus TaxID=34613 RepID=A0A6B0UR52_IXORI